MSDIKLLTRVSAESRIPPENRIFVNRNLRMASVEAIGFDLDHTLAHYRGPAVEEIAFQLTRERLVTQFGYPEELLAVPYDRNFVIRGLVIDKRRGNILKMDYYNYVARGYHGFRRVGADDRKTAYRSGRVRMSSDAYVSVDTLFHLPEVFLYVVLVDLVEKGKVGKHRRPFAQDLRGSAREHRLRAPRRDAQARDPRKPGEVHPQGSATAARARGASRRGQEALSAHQQRVLLQRGAAQLPPGERRAQRRGGLARVLRRHRGGCRQAVVLHRSRPGGRAGAARGASVAVSHLPRGKRAAAGGGPRFQRRPDPLLRRPHVRRHPPQQEEPRLAHRHGGGGTQGRDGHRPEDAASARRAEPLEGAARGSGIRHLEPGDGGAPTEAASSRRAKATRPSPRSSTRSWRGSRRASPSARSSSRRSSA